MVLNALEGIYIDYWVESAKSINSIYDILNHLH